MKTKLTLMLLLVVVLISTTVLAAKEYTSTSEKDCNNGRCEMIIYSAERFIQDNYGQWKKLEDVDNLQPVKPLQVDFDGEHVVEINSYNLTSIDVNLSLVLNSTKIGSWIPVKIYNKTENGSLVLLWSTQLKINKATEKKIAKYDFDPNYVIHWGANSTTIVFKFNSTNLGKDANVASGSPTNNINGVSFDVSFISGLYVRSYVGLNISSIPTGAIIENATFNVYITAEILDAVIDFYHVYSNISFTENAVTWNNQPCGTAIATNNSQKCNPQKFYNHSESLGSGWTKYDLTNITQIEVTRALNKTINFMMHTDTNVGSKTYRSKEGAIYYDNLTFPYLNVTYSEGTNNFPSVNLQSPLNDNITTSNQPSFVFNYTDDQSTATCTLYINSTTYGTNSSCLKNTVTTIQANNTLANGTYYWNVSVNDGTNLNWSSNRNFTVAYTAPSTGSCACPASPANWYIPTMCLINTYCNVYGYNVTIDGQVNITTTIVAKNFKFNGSLGYYNLRNSSAYLNTTS
jgi:hypothetical protein